MSAPDPADLKRRLRNEGFEIYRTLEGRVILAERIRDNLIMDSGVAAGSGLGDLLTVFVTIRTQLSHYPGSNAEAVLDQARQLAQPFEGRGYGAGEPTSRHIQDPSHPERTLDTVFEIPLQRALAGLDELLTELRAVLALPRSSNDG